MPNAANVSFKTTDLTQTVSAPTTGINFILGQANRGPFANPEDIINSWSKFVEIYGGLSTESDAPLLCKRLLEKGGAIRFCRVGHYTDIVDPTSLDASTSTYSDIVHLLIDELLDTGNTINMDINSTAIPEVTFDVDNTTTMELIREAILTNPDVEAVGLGKDSTGEIINITITPKSGLSLVVDNVIVAGGSNSPTFTVTDVTATVSIEGDDLFTLVPKYAGEDNNNFKQIIEAPTNGAPGYFNLVLQHTIELGIREEYQNLKINGNPTAENSNYLDRVISESKYFNVQYHDLSNLTGQLNPAPMEVMFTGGSNGTPPTDEDYIGDSAGRNGFHAFDEYDDSYNLAVFDNTSDAVMVAGAAYVAARKDLTFFLEIPPTIRTKSAILAKRNSLNIDNKFVYILAGGLKIKDPITGQDKEILGVADVLANENMTSNEFGPWYSFAGNTRGVITNALGVVNNYGAHGNYRDLNDLANQQINMVINRDGAIKVWGNFSAQVATTQQSQLSVVKLLIFLQKSLRPTLENYLEEPNDIPTWKRIYYTVLPFLEGMVTKRALYTYEWQGDQFAKSLDDLKVNDKTDVGNGKYKILFPIKAIPSLQEIGVNIILTPAGVDFEVAAELI